MAKKLCPLISNPAVHKQIVLEKKKRKKKLSLISLHQDEQNQIKYVLLLIIDRQQKALSASKDRPAKNITLM